jgi:hypothetical protein
MTKAAKRPTRTRTNGQASKPAPVTIAALAALTDADEGDALEALEALMLGIEPKTQDEARTLLGVIHVEVDTLASWPYVAVSAARMQQLADALAAVCRAMDGYGARNLMA